MASPDSPSSMRPMAAWLSTAPLHQLVPALLLATYVAQVPLIVLAILGVDVVPEGGPALDRLSAHMVVRLLVVAVIGPAFETVLFQWLLIRIGQRIRLPGPWTLVASAAAFGATHAYSMGYVILAFLSGLVYGIPFVARTGPTGRQFLACYLTHGLRNAIAVLLSP